MRIDDSLIQSQLTTIGGDFEHIVLLGIDSIAMHGGSTFRKLLDKFFLCLGGLGNLVVVNRFWAWKIQLVSRFNIRSLFPDVDELGKVVKFGKSCPCSIAGSLRRKLNDGFGLTEVDSPAVKMAPSLFPERIALQIPHHGVQLCHGIADGGSGCKNNTSTTGFFVQILALHIHVGRLLGICG